MKNILVLLFFITIIFISSELFATGIKNTRGYFNKNGNYVKGYISTKPNKTKMDNWSTKWNINPFTGRAGTKNPLK